MDSPGHAPGCPNGGAAAARQLSYYSDVGIWANAPTPSGLFEGLGLALFGIMTDLRKIRPAETRNVEASAEDLPSLVVAFLTELLLLEQADGFVGRQITARTLGTPPIAVLAPVSGNLSTKHVIPAARR